MMRIEMAMKAIEARVGNRDEFIEKVEQALIDAGVWATAYWSEPYSYTIKVEVDGDWKHDHLRTNWILFEQFGLAFCGEYVTDEDGSDCYASIHTYEFEV